MSPGSHSFQDVPAESTKELVQKQEAIRKDAAFLLVPSPKEGQAAGTKFVSEEGVPVSIAADGLFLGSEIQNIYSQT